MSLSVKTFSWILFIIFLISHIEAEALFFDASVAIKIDVVRMHDATVSSVLEFIRLKANQQLTELRNEGIAPKLNSPLSFEYKYSPEKSFIRIDFVCTDMNLGDTLQMLAKKAHIKVTYSDDRVIITDEK